MSTKLLGKPVADEIYKDIDNFINKLQLCPTCNLIYDNLDNGNEYYRKAIVNNALKHGIKINSVYIEPSSSREDCIDFIAALKEKNATANFLLQPCINKNIEECFTEFVDIKSDIDCITERRLEKSFLYPTYIPCTCKAVLKLLDYYNIFPEGKTICILGRSRVVGLPLVNALINRDATVISCNHYTTKANMFRHISNSDIVISCMGNPNVLTEEIIKGNTKQNFTFIDVSTNTVNGVIQGDISDELKEQYTEYYTSPNNGIGIVTTAILLQEIVDTCIENMRYM